MSEESRSSDPANVDVKNATIRLVGDINEKSFNTVVDGIGAIKECEVLTILLGTYGGEFYWGLAIYDYLKYCGLNLKIFCVGPVMSAGIIILQAGHDRVATPNSQFMIHYGQDSNESESDALQNAKMLKLMKDIIGGRAKVKKRTLNKWFNMNSWMDSKLAIKNGIIDRMTK